MMIGENFILLNLPKTASTFARQAIKKAYYIRNSWLDRTLMKFGVKKKGFKELLLPNIKVKYRTGKDQHGIYDQIPQKYLDNGRELVSIIRDPFAGYVSRYTFESWKKNNPYDLSRVKERFPHFPDLSFKEYLEYSNNYALPHRLQNVDLKEGTQIGTLSAQFIQMFCRDHKEALRNINKDYKKNGLYEKHFPDITFLKTENINDDLYRFLLRKGFSKENVQFIQDREKVNVSNRRPYHQYLDKEAIERIMELEWLLFDLFPEYNPEHNDQLKIS